MRQQQALMRLLAAGDTVLSKRIQLILRMAAEALEIERVGYWELRARGQRLSCEAQYQRSREAFQHEPDLSAAEHPELFRSLSEGVPLIVDDVVDDGRFESEHWRRVRAGAVLCVPVYMRGELIGMVVHEHSGSARHWGIDEQNFAISIAQLISLANKTERLLRAEEALRASEAHFRSMVEASPVPMVVLTVPEGVCLYGNRAAAEAVGLPYDQLVGKRTRDFYWTLEDRDQVAAELRERRSLVGRELRFKRVDGSPCWFNVSAQSISFAGNPALVVGFVDVTEHKRMEEAFRHMALHDVLTGLPNRALFHDMLARELAHARRAVNYRFAVLFIDLDNFKEVNDYLGHAAGDSLLIALAREVKACLRPKDLFARMGGDEFAVLLGDVKSDEEVARVADRVRDVLSRTYNLAGHDVAISGSVGVVLDKPSYTTADGVMRAADKAMYRAKAEGRDRCVVLDGRALKPRRTSEFRLVDVE